MGRRQGGRRRGRRATVPAVRRRAVARVRPGGRLGPVPAAALVALRPLAQPQLLRQLLVEVSLRKKNPVAELFFLFFFVFFWSHSSTIDLLECTGLKNELISYSSTLSGEIDRQNGRTKSVTPSGTGAPLLSLQLEIIRFTATFRSSCRDNDRG